MRLPYIQMDSVFHVGTMDAGNVGRNGPSQEGHCLSVSLCPSAWQGIARLGGNGLYALERAGGTFLDVHAVLDDPDTLASVRDWAVAEGLVEVRTLWRAYREDGETDEWGYTTHATAEAAMAEVDFDGDYENPADVPGPDGKAGVESFEAHVGTAALAEATGMRLHPEDDATDAMVMAWARLVASDLAPSPLDGLWWREAYDPDALSAPRGAIFPERVHGWATATLSWKQAPDDEEGIGGMPETDILDLDARSPSPR